MARVTLYTREGCAHCARMREALAAEGARIDEVNLTRQPEALPEFLKVTRGRRIVPVVVRGGRIEVAPEGGSDV